MKYLTLGAVVLLAACGGESGNKAKAQAPALEGGQYELTATVTQFSPADEGTPRINTPVGTRTTRSMCVSDGAALPADLFADEGMTCEDASSSYSRNGRINVSVRCTAPNLDGPVNYAVSGTYEAQSFRADRQLTTTFTTDGDVTGMSTIEGRRTGECTAPAAAELANKAKESGK